MRFATHKDVDGWFVTDLSNGHTVSRKGRNTCKAIARSLNAKEARITKRVRKIMLEIRKGDSTVEIKARELAAFLGCKKLKKRDHDLVGLPLNVAKSHHAWRTIHSNRGGVNPHFRAQLITLEMLMVNRNESGIINFLTSGK